MICCRWQSRRGAARACQPTHSTHGGSGAEHQTIFSMDIFFKNYYSNTFSYDVLAAYENTVRENDDRLDKTETECIVSALIANGYMKGYIAHAHEKVVMSRKDPFPVISTI